MTIETTAVVTSRQISGLRNRVRNPPYPGMGGVSVSLPGLNPVSWCPVLLLSRLRDGLMPRVPVMLLVSARSGLALFNSVLRVCILLDLMILPAVAADIVDRLPRLLTTPLPAPLWSS